MVTDGQGTAVVIGGGLAGCLAAVALADRLDRVVVLERDRYPADPVCRPGTPQGHHAHLLLEGGRRALQSLLPGLDEELRLLGAVRVPVPSGMRWLSPWGWLPSFSSDLAFTSCTRPVLDAAVRRRAAAEPAVEFRPGTEVVGLLGGPAGVTGVRTRPRGQDRDRIEQVPAALVVDASGRSSGLAQWLPQIGCRAAPEEKVDAGIAYCSRLFRRPAEVDPARTVVYLQAKAPGQPRLGVLLPVEGGRWIVSLGGMRGAEPAGGEKGFREHLDRLRDPALREALAGAEPDGDVRGFRPGASIRRRYERSAPEGLVVLGDAACTFNPVYGQGMSIAALGALALRDTVRERGLAPGTARRAQRRVAAAGRDAWVMSSGEDVRFPDTVGGPSGALVRLQHRYLDRVIARSCQDEAVCATFTEVMSLVAPPSALLRPGTAWPVLTGR